MGTRVQACLRSSTVKCLSRRYLQVMTNSICWDKSHPEPSVGSGTRSLCPALPLHPLATWKSPRVSCCLQPAQHGPASFKYHPELLSYTNAALPGIKESNLHWKRLIRALTLCPPAPGRIATLRSDRGHSHALQRSHFTPGGNGISGHPLASFKSLNKFKSHIWLR